MHPIQAHKLLFAVVLLAATWAAVDAPANISTNTLKARIEKAQAEKTIDNRLQALANVAKELPLAEIPDALSGIL